MMKNLFFAAAVAALACAGCAAEDEGVTPASGSFPIDFGTSEITRSQPIDAFADDAVIGVFGTETIDITDGASTPTSGWMVNMKLTNNSGSWTPGAVKYFVTGYKYTFGAYAPYMDGVTDLASVSYTASTTLSEQKDLMYADFLDSYDFSVTAPKAETAKVKFTFHHALAQVKFSAKTAADYSTYYNVKVTKIQLTGVNTKATLNAKTGVWDESSLGTPMSYEQTISSVGGQAIDDKAYTVLPTDDVLMLIPQDAAACSVVLTVEATSKTDPAVVKKQDITVNFTGDNVWAKNKIYRYKVSLSLNAILGFENATFQTPSVDPWDATEIDKPI